MGRVEVEEESTEGQFKEETQEEERKTDDARREKRVAGEEIANLVVGGELEMGESEAEAEAAAPLTL